MKKKQQHKRFKIFIYTLMITSVCIALSHFQIMQGVLNTSLFYGTDEIESSRPFMFPIPDYKKSGLSSLSICDVAVVGGGTSGFAAGIQSARMGIDTCIFEEKTWLGGMFTAAGVSAFDGGWQELFRGGIFGEVRWAIEQYYQYNFSEANSCSVSFLCFEPRVAKRIIDNIIRQIDNLQVFYLSQVTEVYGENNNVTGLKIKSFTGDEFTVPTKVVIDATEFGDVVELSGAAYDLGIDQGSGEPHANNIEECIQPITYVMIISDFGRNVTIPEPPNYDKENYKCSIRNSECPDAENTFQDLLDYGRLPSGKFMINWPNDRWGNDFHATDPDLEEESRQNILQRAKYYSLGFLYFIQTELGYNNYGLTNEFSTADKLPVIPYVRESRRIKGVDRLTEFDILPDQNGKSKSQDDVIALADHPIDLHYCESREDLYSNISPFQIPYGVLVPEKIDGLLAAEKNVSVTHIVNGASRVQPVVMTIGQAAGAAAALAVQDDIEVRDINVRDLQNILIEDGVALFYYQDISPFDDNFQQIMQTSLDGYFKGFQNKFFYGDAEVSRKEILKLAYTSRDPSLKNEYDQKKYTDKAYKNGVITGFVMSDGVYLHLDGAVTRAEAIKILLKVFGYEELNHKISPFEDTNDWSFGWIERAYSLGLIKGVSNNKFDPHRNLNRAEAAVLISRIQGIPRK